MVLVSDLTAGRSTIISPGDDIDADSLDRSHRRAPIQPRGPPRKAAHSPPRRPPSFQPFPHPRHQIGEIRSLPLARRCEIRWIRRRSQLIPTLAPSWGVGPTWPSDRRHRVGLGRVHYRERWGTPFGPAVSRRGVPSCPPCLDLHGSFPGPDTKDPMPLRLQQGRGACVLTIAPVQGES